MPLVPRILNQLIWNQVITAFSWNRSPNGDVMVITEPVMQALAHAVAQLLGPSTDPDSALTQFVADVRANMANPPQVPALPPLAALAATPAPVTSSAEILAFKRLD